MPFNWVKTHNDAGGYWAKGLVVSPTWTMWGNPNALVVSTYPWDCGVPSGYLKNPNSGWARYGYFKDGYNNLYNGGEAYKESVTGIGFALYTSAPVDENGYITLDMPITIKMYSEE